MENPTKERSNEFKDMRESTDISEGKIIDIDGTPNHEDEGKALDVIEKSLKNNRECVVDSINTVMEDTINNA